MNSNEIYQKVNSIIFEKMKEGNLPWRQPWSSFGPPSNFVTKRAYRGINHIMLSFTKDPYPYYLTFKQAKDLGGSIRKGSKGHFIVFSKNLLFNRETRQPLESWELSNVAPELVNKVYYLKFSHVFNVSCVEGIDLNLPELPKNDSSSFDTSKAKAIIAQMPNAPRIQHGGDSAFYAPMFDLVNMPVKELFDSEEQYYHVHFHELIHSTGHFSRLSRSGIQQLESMKSASYSFEELVAEMGACYLSNSCGHLPNVIDNSAAYLKNWLDKLQERTQEDPSFLAKAASEAQKASDYIINLSQPTDEVDSSNELTVREIEV